MANDIKTTVDGDLDLTVGMVIASDREADRALLTNRSMTIRGEVAVLPTLGLSDFLIGKPINNVTIQQLRFEVLQALTIDGALSAVSPTIRIIPTGTDQALVFIQSNREYADGLGRLTIIGDYWNRDESMTFLDGTEF